MFSAFGIEHGDDVSKGMFGSLARGASKVTNATSAARVSTLKALPRASSPAKRVAREGKIMRAQSDAWHARTSMGNKAKKLDRKVARFTRNFK